jgi:hypothetical protein
MKIIPITGKIGHWPTRPSYLDMVLGMSGGRSDGYSRWAPGWYADPADPRWLRYWDGTAWTMRRRPTPPPGAPPRKPSTSLPRRITEWFNTGTAAARFAKAVVALLVALGVIGGGGAVINGIVNSGSGPLLSSADLEQTVGGSWQATAATRQYLDFSCFSLPANPSKSQIEGLSETLGAKVYEVVDSFPTTAGASQAYANFTSTTNNCSWENTSKEGTTSQFTAVPDSNAPDLDSESSIWDIEGAPVDLGGATSHDGAICAVQSGNLDAFVYILVDNSNSPSLTTVENSIEPALARKL